MCDYKLARQTLTALNFVNPFSYSGGRLISMTKIILEWLTKRRWTMSWRWVITKYFSPDLWDLFWFRVCIKCWREWGTDHQEIPTLEPKTFLHWLMSIRMERWQKMNLLKVNRLHHCWLVISPSQAAKRMTSWWPSWRNYLRLCWNVALTYTASSQNSK